MNVNMLQINLCPAGSSLLVQQAHSPCFRSRQTLLWLESCVLWHLRQEFPGKIVKRFFWFCWQEPKGFRVPLSGQMGREEEREGKSKRRTLLSDCISSEACTKKAEMWLDDWILFLHLISHPATMTVQGLVGYFKGYLTVLETLLGTLQFPQHHVWGNFGI